MLGIQIPKRSCKELLLSEKVKVLHLIRKEKRYAEVTKIYVLATPWTVRSPADSSVHFPNPGTDPDSPAILLHLLHGQVDSSPLSHQRSVWVGKIPWRR